MLRTGRDVSRIEGFSDAVFGFALTLLVASIEVPPDFDALKQTLRGFLPFALTFALISWIWYLHYSFFRQFGLEDRLTIVLNSILLFVVLFFVYPLKVMANLYDIGTALRAHAASMLLGVTSVILAVTLPMSLFALAGLIYDLEGPLQGGNGWLRGTRRGRVFPSSTPARR